MTESPPINYERYLINAYNEQYLHSVNGELFQQNDSHTVFSKHFKQKLFGKNNFYVFIGTDSGLLINYLIHKGLSEGARYLFIEHPQLIEAIVTNTPQLADFQATKTLAICTPEQWEQCASDMQIEQYIYKDSVKFYKSIAAVDAYFQAYNDLSNQVEIALQNNIFITKAQLGSEPFIIKSLHNISELTHPAQLLADKFQGKTCILLGGGPSLDHHIDWIDKNKDKLIIMAASRICRKLINLNITPHFIFAIDPQDLCFDMCKDIFHLNEEVIFIHAYHVSSQLISQWHGKHLYLGERFPWKSKLNEKNIRSIGPTVTQAAMACAIEFGFETIVLAGIDLCYSESGYTHTKDTDEANHGPKLGNNGQWVETYQGNMAETCIQLIFAIQAMEELAEFAQNKNIPIVNISSSAARIKGIDYKNRNELNLVNSEQYFQEILHLLPENCDKFLGEHNQNILKEIRHTLAKIVKIKTLAKQALHYNQALFQKNNRDDSHFKNKIRMDKIEKQFQTEYADETKFIKTFGIFAFINSIPAESSEPWSEEKMEMTGRLYYEAYVSTCNHLINLLEPSIYRIESRLEELKFQPNFDRIFKQWELDQQIGRANIWVKNHADKFSTLPKQTQQQLLDYQNQFFEIVNNPETKLRKLIMEESPLSGVKAKIIYLYQHQNKAGLNQLANALNQMKDNHDATDFLHFCQSFIFLLENDENGALVELEKIIQIDKHEEMLKQLASLSLNFNQMEKAESTLMKLSLKAEIYIPIYAQVLKINNKIDKSIDLYSEYLNNNPMDIPVWLALGQVYLEIGATESAQMTFLEVLKLDPKNQAALNYLHKIN